MRIAVLTFLLSAAPLLAARNNIKPEDFQPLTNLPWQQPNATLDSTLQAIFLEPNPDIRYPVLAEYLHAIPVAQLGKAFDECITLECAQTPNQLVLLFLDVWAQRDPKGCLNEIRRLIHLVGFEDEWVIDDVDDGRPKLTVQDIDAIRASRFWIQSGALMNFPGNFWKRPLSRQDMQPIHDFEEMWFRNFKVWPGNDRYDDEYPGPDSDTFERESIQSFSEKIDSIRNRFTQDVQTENTYTPAAAVAIEIELRRWLQADPASAPLIIEKSREFKWATHDDEWLSLPGSVETRTTGPSVELLLLWSKADMPGMISWADHRDVSTDVAALRAKALLMSHVPPETRTRWLSEISSEELRQELRCLWAEWDPLPAMDAVVGSFSNVGSASRPAATYADQDITEAAYAAASGPFNNSPFNTRGFGIGAVESYDFSRLPTIPKPERYDWYGLINRLSDVDIGEAARFGVELELRTIPSHRDRLLSTFSGQNIWPGTGGGVDMVYTALRLWVVFHPKELAAWIPTLNDPDLQNAMKWLLKHPQGGGPSGTEILEPGGPMNHAHTFNP